jgi:Tol biopolymer transport system component
VWVIGSDGSDPHQVSHTTGTSYAFLYPQWSPDSSRLVFYAGDDGSHRIWVVTLGDGTERQVSQGPGDEFWPSWSPDGDRIAFLRATDVGSLVIAEPDSDRLTLVTPPMQGGIPMVWSPDGTRLLSFTPDVLAPAIVDPDGVVPPVTLPAVSPWQSGSWQRLAP